MIFPVGSTLWLLAHEIRLAWRGTLFRRGRRRALILGGLLLAATAGFGVPLALAIRHLAVPVIPVTAAVVDAALAVVFTLMLSQTLAGATETLYSRGDLDLMFSSPLAPRKVLTVRLAAIAANIFAAFAILVTPLLLPVAVVGHPGWLAAYLVLAALALAATGAGLVIAMGLFRLIGPRRTRAVAQILAAVIGAAFFLAAQARNILGARQTSLLVDLADHASRRGFHIPPAAGLPLRAMLGEVAPLAALLAVGGLAFAVSAAWVGGRFAVDSAAAGGADLAAARPGRALAPFAAGAFAATVRKELRLLVRDIALLAQVLLRVLYLLPLMFLVLRNAGTHADWALPAGVAAMTFVAGQVAGSLTWITMSAEDAPELLACAPAPISTIRRAKLTAALAPLATLLAIPLIVLTAIAPAPGVAAILGCAASALAAGLVNTWWQKPARRADFRRRRSGAWTAGLAQFLVGGLIAAAAGLAALASPFALGPAALAAVALLVVRRDETQIARAIAAG